MTRLKATLIIEYDADPDHYRPNDPASMAAIDQEAMGTDLWMLPDLADRETADFTLTVEPVDQTTKGQ